MHLLLAAVTSRRSIVGAAGELVQLYMERAGKYAPAQYRAFATEAKLLEFATAAGGRTVPKLVLADSRGSQLTSEEFAGVMRGGQNAGTQLMIVAIGPADGWSATALARADHTFAFGRITLPHELATVVLAEQMYRALTILAGHPYHCGH